MKEGGDPFEVKIQGPDGPVPATVTDNGDGTYRVDYQPETAGPHTVDVDLAGKPIKGSTFHVDIKPGAWASTSTIENYTFTIRMKDKRGAFVTEGGEDVKVKVTAPSGQDVPVNVRDNNNGSLTVSYKLPAEIGEFRVEVLLNGEHIVGSPFTQIVA
jgi:filamin